MATMLATTNPLREGLRTELTAEPCAVVIFGATGDLTHRKLIPALYNLALERRLPAGSSLVGFARRPWGDDGFTSASGDRAGLYLCRGIQGRGGAWAWVGVSDPAALYRDYTGRGVAVRVPPTNYPWALEMHVEDPDGNILCFGSEPLATEPFAKANV